jgi:hypothetical protein
MREGQLAPNELVISMITEELPDETGRGFLLDGVPTQADALDHALRARDRQLTAAILMHVPNETGAMLGAIDLVRVEKGMKVRDITLSCIDAAHGARVAAAVGGIEGVTVQHVLDRTFELHLGARSR